jgi:hypothetical protein
MRRTEIVTTLVLLAGSAMRAQAQMPDLKFFDRFGDKCEETVNITLDENLLKAGAGLLNSDKSGEGAEVKGAISGIRQIFVRSCTFKADGGYTQADLDQIYAQLKGPGWSPIVEVKEKHERTTIHLKSGDPANGGMLIVAAEPRELTVVYIRGNIDLEKLGKLGGNFGIPDVNVHKKSSPTPEAKPSPNKEEEDDK